MGNSLHAAMVEFLDDVAVFSLTAVAYASLISAVRCAPGRSREIAGGAVFGLGAIFCMVAQHYAGPSAPITEGTAAVALAAPFAGSLAGIVAAALAAGFCPLLGDVPAYPGMAELLLAALIGIAAAEILRRRRLMFGGGALLALAGALMLGSIALLLPKLGLVGLSNEVAWAVAVQQPASVLVFGLLLLRWGNAEKRLAESERRWHALVANVPGAVVQISVEPSGEIAFSYVSLEAAKVFGEGALDAGRDPSRILGLLHPEDRSAFKRSLVDAGRRLSPWSLEFRILDPQGKARWLRGRALPHSTDQGGVLWDGIIVNVTSRKDVEKALRLSEDLYRLLAENTTEVIARIGPDGKWIYVSPPVRHILGYDPAELAGQSWLAIVHADEIERVAGMVTPLAPGGAPVVLSYRARRKDGTYLWVEDTRRIAGKSGLEERYETISVIRPIVRRRSEARSSGTDSAAARERNASFARLLEATNAGVIVTDPHQPDNPIVFANAAATAITGYEAAELLGRNCRLLQGADTDRGAIEKIRSAIREERSISIVLINYRKDGTPFWSKLDISPVRGADGTLEAFVSVFLDITEQKRVEDELRHARDAAEQANQAKSDFIANISHELRTPLNGVIGFTNLLLNENLPAEQRRYATFARDAGSSLLAIINNVLDLSKIEAGRLELTEADFSVIELAVSCNTVVWHAAREKGLDLNFVLKPDVMNVARGDPDRIRQVLLNLLSNAIKFTEKGNVVLSISKAGDTPTATILRFSVTDTGIGIAKEKQLLLFQKFSQLDDGAGRHLGGTGLGLAICKSLVERMGGKIGVTSTPGIGSKFWFTVPLKPAIDTARRDGVTPRRKARILLVEDMPMNQELMITLLRRAGHEVDVVGDGEAALAAVKGQAFDVVLMDVQLPRMDGLAATRAIRSLDGPVRNTPIIAMTARALSKDVEQCLAAGMNDHLPKPIDAAALLAVIDHWTRSRDPLERHPSGPASANAAIRDPAVLVDLERHLGRDRVASMMAAASADIPRRLDRIARHLSDHALVEREAHELVSVVGNLGFTELTACARGLMEASGGRDDVQIRAACAALQVAAARALPLMGSLPTAGAAE
jgi:PAS domain S-box-containing protein